MVQSAIFPKVAQMVHPRFSKPLGVDKVPVRILRDFMMPRLFKNGKPRAPIRHRAGSEYLTIGSNFIGGARVLNGFQVVWDDSYGWGDPLREGVDFEFIDSA